jgi:hypothetical protein
VTHRLAPFAAAVLTTLLLAACAEPAQVTTAGTDPQPQQVQVVVSPATATVAAGAERQFAAAVTGTANTAVTWSLQEGVAAGAVDATGLYVAPAAAGTFHVVATSVADPSRSDVALVTVTATPPPPPPPPPPPAVTVTVTPRSGTVDECQALTFQASVAGTTNGAVTWSLQEGATAGTISTGGVYTAAAAGTYHVVATSVADPTKADVVPVVVNVRVLGVAVSPATITVPASGTTTFTANVTTTCGTFASLRTVNARGEISTP